MKRPRIRAVAVIAILCASLTAACSTGADHSAAPAPTQSSAPGSPTAPGSSVPSPSTVAESRPAAVATSSTATDSAPPAARTSSAIPTYNQSTVSQTSKPTEPSNKVISLGDIGSPTIDSRHPNQSAGHMIPPDTAPDAPPHCILVYNQIVPQALTIVSVTFRVYLADGVSGEFG
jgi:hypothetical protein